MPLKKIKLKHIFSFLLVFFITTLIIDSVRISNYEIIPKDPKNDIPEYHDQMQWALANNQTIEDWNLLNPTLEFIKNEYDCSDFRLVNLIRMLYEEEHHIPTKYHKKIENVLFNFRYWMDEPGENSMCYWSENHQILFASAEYLVGQKYPHTVFKNSGLKGQQHLVKAKKRIMDWLKMRWNYGFTEFNSGVYYPEDIAALINLIDFAHDPELVKKSQMIMDLLLFDVASQNIKTMFVTASGRAYEPNRKGGPFETLGGVTNYYWGDGKPIGPGMMYGLMTTKKYQLPPVLAEIGRDSSEVVIKQSHGLDISDLKAEGFYGTDSRSLMMQWGMEAFTNPEVIRNSLHHVRTFNLFSNEFLSGFKGIDYHLIKWLHLEPIISKFLKPQSNGTAIQKGNTYTYKTKDYSMYSAQNYHPGTYADQQHVFGVNIKNHFSVFHTHPALLKNQKGHSPNYEVGYGYLPHVAQYKNINLAVYHLPDKKSPLGMEILNFTRVYFPTEKFDDFIMEHNYLFGKKGTTYVAFIGKNNLDFADSATDDIIQPGKKTFWITEASSSDEDGSFEMFINRVKNNSISFNKETLVLRYQSKNKVFVLKFNGKFLIDGQVINTNYPRFDSPYIKAKRKDKTMTFQLNGKSLFLDFENMKREFN